MRAGGWIIYDGDEFPADCEREGVHVLAAPFTQLADDLGDKRAANMVMLGALLEIAGALPQASIDAALRRLIKNPRWVELDERAMARGQGTVTEGDRFAEVVMMKAGCRSQPDCVFRRAVCAHARGARRNPDPCPALRNRSV